MVFARKTKKIGELLIDAGLITPSQLDEAISQSKRIEARVGSTLVKMGIVPEEKIAEVLAKQFNIPYISLNTAVIDQHLIKIVPEALARRYMVLPYEEKGDVLKVAMVDPLDVFAIDELEKLAGGYRIMPSVATESDIKKAIDRLYEEKGAKEDFIKGIVDAADIALVGEEAESPEVLEKIAGEAKVIKLVDSIIQQAVSERASDIHIEPDEDALRIRYRIDGVLHKALSLDMKLHPAIVSRVKILSDLNIAERRLPQDGRTNIKFGSKEIDIRVSTLPTLFGETVVLRLLDKSSQILKLEELTPFQDTVSILRKVIKRPYGMLFLTGPTGSGKTTTAYTLLNILNTIDKKIVTVEDPVEYYMKIVNQVQVNPKVGITFATALRHVLRQDPDIIMIGEVRDRETAEIAVHAALTGHLVLSTLHTSNSVGAITRLIDMGIEPFLITSSIICVAAQRLVKRICENCKVQYKPDMSYVNEMNIAPYMKAPDFYKGEGCPNCKGTGFKGRLAIYEMLLLDDDLRKLILAKADSNIITEAAIKKGFRTLRQEGIRAVIDGYTTLEEILHATQDVE